MKYIFIILFYLLLTNVNAWNSKSHNIIVETVYYKSDFDLQQNLNLSLLKEGSSAPDLDFHDTASHSYPRDYPRIERWLKAASENYSTKNYNDASYAFGVASHYIADSFVAPHYIIKEPGSLHSKFEKLKDYNINIKCYNQVTDLNKSLEFASKNKEDWTNWTLNKDPETPKREFEQAVHLMFPVFLTTFNSSCNNFTTEVVKQKFRINNNVITFLGLTLIFYLSFILNKKYKWIKRIKF
jgi:hypothetical protein